VPDVADQIALDLGILWGGNHRFTRKDRMHFEVHKTPAEVAGAQVPALPPPAFPLAAGWAYGMAGRGAKVVSGSWNPGPYTAAIQMIQRVVRASPDGVYGPRTDAAVRTGQALHRIVVDGLVGPITWRKLFP
jgi:peptidoglycan hydrolase-like protein with peptidoglycan-binding domain